MSNVTALATVPPQANSLSAYEPKDMSQAFQLATYFAKSNLLGELHTPEQVMLIMATGAELGIPPTTAIRAIHIIKGKPVVSADLKVALCLRRKDRCEYFVLIKSDEEHAVYETKPVGGQPVQMKFTLDDAKRAKLSFQPDSNWCKYPRVMLRHRASAELAQAVYPDLVLGLGSEDDDGMDSPHSRGPVVMDAEFTEQATTTTKAPEKEQPKANEKAKTNEERAARWLERLSTAKTAEEANAVRHEVKQARLPNPFHDQIGEAWGAAMARIKAASSPAAAQANREPGSDDE